MATLGIGPLLRQALTRRQLHAAWEKVADNRGMPGTDGESIDDIAPRITDELAQLARDVIAGNYQPRPLRRIWIERPGKRPRGLAIPAVRDRILQTSLTLALTPCVEAELEDCAFAYRQGRGVRQAVERIGIYQRQGYRWIVDADIESFFDNIPHPALLARLQAIAPEPALIQLVALWLTGEIDEGGRLLRPTRGIAQGSPLSPLLANLYLDTLDDALLDADHILVRYADDFVVLAKTQARAEAALALTREVLDKLALRLNPVKTRIVHLDNGLEFLGWHFVRSLALPRQWKEEASAAGGTTYAPGNKPGEPVEPVSGMLAAALQDALAHNPGWQATNRASENEPAANPGDQSPGQPCPESPTQSDGELESNELPEMLAANAIEASKDFENDGSDAGLPPLAPLQRTLYLVSLNSALTVDNQRYQVLQDGKPILSLPPINVDAILVFGNIPVSPASLQLAARHQCPVSFLSRFGRCYGRFEAPGTTHAALLEAQFARRTTPDFGLSIARALLAAKLHHSTLTLSRSQRHHKDPLRHRDIVLRLRELEATLKTAPSIDSLRGSEGSAAALYWKAYAELLPPPWTLTRRQSYPAPDPVNALLSLGYSILYHSVAGLLQARGLHAGLGWLHVGGNGHHALPPDLMEPYRAYVIDATLLHLIRSGQLPAEEHRTVGGRCQLGQDTVRHFIRALEHRFGSVQQHPQRDEAMDLRRVIDHDILQLIAALRSGNAQDFAPTRWR